MIHGKSPSIQENTPTTGAICIPPCLEMKTEANADIGSIDEQLAKTSRDIRQVVDELAELLIRKNAAYGDSALNPMRIFSSASPDEQIKVRLDDKLNRIRNSTLRGQTSDDFSEDVIKDLMGYLVLLRICQLRNQPLTDTAAPVLPPMTEAEKFQRLLRSVDEFRAMLEMIRSEAK